MFKFEQEFVTEYFDASMDFFINKFFLRFMLINIAGSAGLLFFIMYLFNLDTSSFIFFIIPLAWGFVATSITFFLIKGLKFKEKKINKETNLVFVTNRPVELSDRALLVRISFAYYWRVHIASIVLSCLSYPLIAMFNVNWSGTPFILGFLSMYLGWFWFTLLNDKTGVYINFSSRVID